MTRGAVACFRLELRRGRANRNYGFGGAIALAFINAVHGLDADSEITILLLVLPLMFAALIGMRPYFSLMGDRVAGRLALERALPQSWRLTAAARLAAAAVNTLASAAIVAAVLVGVARHTEFQPSLQLSIGIVIISWAAVTVTCWILMALNARWSLIRLWWIPTTIWFAPQFVPGRWFERVWVSAQPVVYGLLDALASGRGGVALGAIALAALTVVGAGATALYASGLRRFEHDPDPFGLIGKRDQVVRVLEYPVGQRDMIPAVALLGIRLGVERLVKQGFIIVGLVVVAVVGPDALSEMAPTYIRIIGAMVPGAIVFGIVTGRHSGALASLQQLPHPRWKIAVGHLVAVVALAVIGSLVMAVGGLVGDSPDPFGPMALARRVTWIAGGAWMAAVIAMWWKRRHLLWLIALGAVVGVIVALLARGGLVAGVLVAVTRHPGIASVAMAVVAVAGVPLFAHGLRTYQPR